MSGSVGRPGDGARRVLGDRDGADRLLPVLPRPQGPPPEPGARRGCARGTRRSAPWSALGLLLLLVSGLPWTGVWGAKAQEIATGKGSSMWSTDHGAASDPASTLDESLPHSHAPRGALGAGGQSRCPSSSDPGGEGSVANVDTAIAVADGEGLRHPMTVALPADRGRRVLGDRLRVRRAVGRAHRPRRQVRRRGRLDVRLRRLPGAGEGGEPGHRTARGPQPRPVVVLGVGADVHGDHLLVRDRPADVVAPPAQPGWVDGRAAGTDAACARRRCWPSDWWRSACFLPLFGLSVLAVLALDQLVVRRVPALAAWFDAT